MVFLLNVISGLQMLNDVQTATLAQLFNYNGHSLSNLYPFPTEIPDSVYKNFYEFYKDESVESYYDMVRKWNKPGQKLTTGIPCIIAFAPNVEKKPVRILNG